MERRYFYASGPRDVLSGLFSASLGLAALAMLIYAACLGSLSVVYWALKLGCSKLGVMVLVGFSTMLYRERIMVDSWEHQVQVKRNWFLIPLSPEEYSFGQIRHLGWGYVGNECHLQLHIGDRNLTLVRASGPDPAVLAEVGALLGLPATAP